MSDDNLLRIANPAYRQVVRMFIDGFTREEVAAKLKVGPNSIKNARVAASRVGIELPSGVAPPRTALDITGANEDADDMSGERCLCGLRLPCNSCLHDTAAAILHGNHDDSSVEELSGGYIDAAEIKAGLRRMAAKLGIAQGRFHKTTKDKRKAG